MEKLNLADAVAKGLQSLSEGAKRFDAEAVMWVSGFLEEKVVKVSIYWVGPVARIDIKGLK